MNLTLHLTENCNMNCSYCVRNKHTSDMSQEVVDRACDMIFSSGKTAGFTFFGGEPLLCKDMIYHALDRCSELSKANGVPFYCKMTTNGSLLDEDFLRVAEAYDMGIGLSFDGLMQDRCRVMKNGAGSLTIVENNAKMLLRFLPRSYAMMTVAPEAADGIAESVRYLYDLGFRRITFTIAYGKNICWTDEALEIVERQLKEVAVFYEKCFSDERFFFGPFDSKIRDLISGTNPAEYCHLGTRQMPVAVDGKIYACTQFIGDEEYCLGDVFEGINAEAAQRMAVRNSRRQEPEDCKRCAIRDRCSHTCGCTNRMETGDENMVSPLTCNYEQMIIRLADEVGDYLAEQCSEKFIRVFG